MVENHPKNLKQAFSAYNLAVRRFDFVENRFLHLVSFSSHQLNDPTSQNDGDLHYSRGVVNEIHENSNSFGIFCLFLLQALQYHEDYAEALGSYERALELDAENEDARNNQEQLLSYLRTITDLLACKVRRT